MSISNCDYNRVSLVMILRTSDLDPLNNRNPFAPTIDPKPSHANATSTAAQITEFVRIYKDKKETFTTYCEFRIILISMNTKKCL